MHALSALLLGLHLRASMANAARKCGDECSVAICVGLKACSHGLAKCQIHCIACGVRKFPFLPYQFLPIAKLD